MKKTALLLASLCMLLFVGCKKDNSSSDDPGKKEEEPTEEFSVVLTNSNIEVVGLSQDYEVAISNMAHQIAIIVDYLDKDELQALEVNIKGLDTGVTATYSKTFNYSDNATQDVTFSDGTSSIVYKISAVCTDPEPHFVGVQVAGIDASAGTIKLASGTNLSALSVTYEVAPAGTKVYVGDTEIASGDVVDFSDKLNGVTFTLVCEDVEEEFNIKAETTGISNITRVWGHYVKPVTTTDTWFGDKVTNTLNALRNIAMDDNYIYISRSEKDDNRGVYAVSIEDPDNVVFMSQNGINAHGVHHTSCVATMDNGTSSVVLLCNLVNAKDQHLYVYKYDSVTSDPVVVLDYTLPEAIRLGDKMICEGDWENGRIWFHDYTSGQKSYVFDVTMGVVSTTPSVVEYDYKTGNIGSMYKISETEYFWAGAAACGALFTISGTTATREYEVDSKVFAYPLHGAQFFTFNEEKYMGYVVLTNSYCDGQFRVSPLPADTMASSLETPGNPWVYELGDPTEANINGDKNANGLGAGVYRVIDGHSYYAAYVPGAGLSLFEIK